MAYKEGFGFTYLKNMDVSDNISDTQLSLAPIINLTNVISEDTELESNRIYNVSTDLVILPDVEVTIGLSATLVISPSVSIDIHGGLLTSSQSILNIMSSDKLYSHSNLPGSVGKLQAVTLYNQTDTDIQNIRCIDSSYGLRFVNMDNSQLSNSYVHSEFQAISGIDSSNFVLTGCSVTGSVETIRAATYFENSPDLTIEKCHFFDNKIGVQISGSHNALVRNNYFIENDMYDFGFAEGGAGTVEYNTFRESQTAIYNFRGQMYANYNDIEAVIGIHSDRVNAWFSAKYNNLKCQTYGIKSQCMSYNPEFVYLDCTRNY